MTTHPLLQLYQEMDPIVEAAAAEHNVPCKKGCNWCCYMLNVVGPTEAFLMATEIMTRPSWRYWVRELYKAANRVLGHDQETYFKTKTPCVFLEKGECTVYEVRPSACRYYFVADDPENCSPDQTGYVRTLNTAKFEAMVWKYEHDKMPPSTMPAFGPLPLSVLHACAFVTKPNSPEEKYVVRLASKVPRPEEWLQSIDQKKMASNTPEAKEAILQASRELGIIL
jgi:Fe-S-cluster containining protein